MEKIEVKTAVKKKPTNTNTVMKTISLPTTMVDTWKRLKRKSELVQIVVSIADTYKNPNDLEDDLRRMLYDRRTKSEE